MKIRAGFVSNSSSSSFVLTFVNLTMRNESVGDILKEMAKAYPDDWKRIQTEMREQAEEDIFNIYDGDLSNSEELARVLGIEPKSEDGEAGEDDDPDFFTDKKFVITGTLEGMTRQEAESSIRMLGGAVSDSVTKNTDFLVLGEDPGKSKVADAKKNSTAVLWGDALVRKIKAHQTSAGDSVKLPEDILDRLLQKSCWIRTVVPAGHAKALVAVFDSNELEGSLENTAILLGFGMKSFDGRSEGCWNIGGKFIVSMDHECDGI